VKEYSFKSHKCNILPQNLGVNYINEGPFQSYDFLVFPSYKFKSDLIPNQYVGYRLSYSNPSDRIGNLFRFEVVNKLHLFGYRKTNAFIQMGYGVGNVEKIANPDSNPFNIILSNRWNLSVSLVGSVQIPIYNSLYLNTDIGLFHLSNGGMDLPNAGFNALYIGGGLSYIQSPYERGKSSHSNHTLQKHNFQVGGFLTRIRVVDFQWVSGLFGHYKHRISWMNNLLFGVDLTLDGARIKERRYWHNDFRKSDLDYVSLGFNAGIEIDFKWALAQATFGVYAINSEVQGVRGYNVFRVLRGIKFTRAPFLDCYVYVGTRTNKFTAKMMEFGLVYDL
jgi:hypothetical protein